MQHHLPSSILPWLMKRPKWAKRLILFGLNCDQSVRPQSTLALFGDRSVTPAWMLMVMLCVAHIQRLYGVYSVSNASLLRSSVQCERRESTMLAVEALARHSHCDSELRSFFNTCEYDANTYTFTEKWHGSTMIAMAAPCSRRMNAVKYTTSTQHSVHTQLTRDRNAVGSQRTHYLQYPCNRHTPQMRSCGIHGNLTISSQCHCDVMTLLVIVLRSPRLSAFFERLGIDVRVRQ